MHFLNVYHCYENVGRLVRTLGETMPTPDTIDQSYRQAIANVRPIAPPASSATVSFEDGPWGQYLTETNLFEAIFVGVRASSSDLRASWKSQVLEAQQYIRSLNEDLGRIMDLLVTDIVLLNTERTGGGSASHIPGLVCISPGPNWTMYDFAETLVHEAIHLNLFVADMLYGIYTLPTATLAEDQYRVLSAVKIGELRPLDKAFHSAVVAVPLMYMQDLRGESTLVDLFTSSLRDCSTGLIDKREFFTDYGKMLVDQLHKFAMTLDYDYVAKSISSSEYAFYGH
ncbi:HEXXH motif-containing putative peptide modification protein [Sphaerisporangium sp. NPDC051017]|uniref:aKG-HExxH-type peptide beta-hydroxylase n=1 Tax=Sphaerisporangium sp. NPDC051017 TaxID=3154636 RepID=UPI00342BCB70